MPIGGGGISGQFFIKLPIKKASHEPLLTSVKKLASGGRARWRGHMKRPGKSKAPKKKESRHLLRLPSCHQLINYLSLHTPSPFM
jgi:hypothetical protein